MGDVRTVSASSDDSACCPTPLATSSPTGDLSEEELRAVCALWSEAFPTAPGRDRYAEAVARLATAGATAEMVHAVFERDGACVAAARSFVRVVGVGGADHDDAEEGAGETPNPSRLAASVDGAGGFVRSSSSNVLRGLEALGGITSSEEVETDLIEGALPPALRSAARGEWKQMREVELAAEVAGKGNSSSWTWNNPMLLQEEFISMNERHRRESSTTTNPIVVN